MTPGLIMIGAMWLVLVVAALSFWREGGKEAQTLAAIYATIAVILPIEVIWLTFHPP